MSERERDKALETIGQCISTLSDRDKWKLLQLKAATLIGLGRRREAIEAFQEALRINPTHYGLMKNLLDSAFALGEYSLAQDVCDRILADHPNDPNDLYINGFLAVRNREFNKATEYFKQLLGVQQFRVVALAAIGAINLCSDNYPQSIVYFRQILLEYRNHPLGTVGLAVVKLKKDDPDDMVAQASVRIGLDQVIFSRRGQMSIDQMYWLVLLSGIFDRKELNEKFARYVPRPDKEKKRTKNRRTRQIIDGENEQLRKTVYDPVQLFAEQMVGMRSSKIWEIIGGLDPVDRTAKVVSQGYTGRARRR